MLMFVFNMILITLISWFYVSFEVKLPYAVLNDSNIKKKDAFHLAFVVFKQSQQSGFVSLQ